MALAPFVYWAQTNTDILLRVDLKEVGMTIVRWKGTVNVVF